MISKISLIIFLVFIGLNAVFGVGIPNIVIGIVAFVAAVAMAFDR